eukprot:TRINITY_DN7723_c0_g1_i1.p1 TRINITY_DN7723_c0_g1~~TRINITY_DN7723_c0_g1_i1.p1  ORF type:complete len:127 (-),score=25.98 TRINITY_DN7723_c0_g1_i1:34-414(-)
MGVVSHEVRSPLNAVIGMMSVAKNDNRISQEIKNEYVEPTLIAGQLMLYLINDVIDYTQIEHCQIKLIEREFDLIQKLQEIVHLVSFQARMKGNRVFLDISDGVPQHMISDAVSYTHLTLPTIYSV